MTYLERLGARYLLYRLGKAVDRAQEAADAVARANPDATIYVHAPSWRGILSTIRDYGPDAADLLVTKARVEVRRAPHGPAVTGDVELQGVYTTEGMRRELEAEVAGLRSRPRDPDDPTGPGAPAAGAAAARNGED
jgi:hypothetical protein